MRPTSRTTCALSFSSCTIWPSMASMRCRDGLRAWARSALDCADRASAEQNNSTDRMEMNCSRGPAVIVQRFKRLAPGYNVMRVLSKVGADGRESAAAELEVVLKFM